MQRTLTSHTTHHMCVVHDSPHPTSEKYLIGCSAFSKYFCLEVHSQLVYHHFSIYLSSINISQFQISKIRKRISNTTLSLVFKGAFEMSLPYNALSPNALKTPS